MPIKLTTLTSKNKIIKVALDEERTLELTLNVGKFTPAFAQKYSASTDESMWDDMACQLEELITDWDVTDDRGKTVKVTKDILLSLPVDDLLTIYKEAQEALIPPALRTPRAE